MALTGTLGSGKTRLVQGVATALGAPSDTVTSPTFVLVNEYTNTRMPVYHFDAYRLRDEDEFLELGPDEYFDGSGVTFVEWADRVASCLPAAHLAISIEVLSQSEREMLVSSDSSNYDQLVERLKEAQPPTE